MSDVNTNENDTPTDEKEAGKEAGTEAGKEVGKEAGKEAGKEPTGEKNVDESVAEEPAAKEQAAKEAAVREADSKETDAKEGSSDDAADDKQQESDEASADSAEPSTAGDAVNEEVEVEPTTEEPLPDVPEGELPEGFDPEEEAAADGDPSHMIDQPDPNALPTHDGADRPEAHDFTQTDTPPELVDPYDSVDTTNPWDRSSDDVDARWDQESLTDAGVTWTQDGSTNNYVDNSNGNTYSTDGYGGYQATVGGTNLTGDEAEAAFNEFTSSRLLTPEEFQQLQENAYKNAPSDGAAGSPGGWSAAPEGETTGGGDVGGSDAGTGETSGDEAMGPPSELAGGGETEHKINDFNGDGQIDWRDKLVDAIGGLFRGPTSDTAQAIDKEMGGSGTDTATRGEQEAGARKELDRQDEENKPDDSGTAEPSHPGWGDGDHRGSSIFDELKNQPGRVDPRNPGNIDPHEDGYGDGGGDATTASSDDLKQPAGPDAEPSGNGTFRPEPEPIDYGPDHVEPIGSGPYDDDPINAGNGTVSLDHDEPDLYDAPIETADTGLPELNDLDLID